MVNKIGWPQLARIAKAIAVLHVAIALLVALTGCNDDGRDSVRTQRDLQFAALATADARTSAIVPTITTEPLPATAATVPAPTIAAFTPTPAPGINVFVTAIEAEEVQP